MIRKTVVVRDAVPTSTIIENDTITSPEAFKTKKTIFRFYQVVWYIYYT